jgi:hypothetical protein
MEKGELQETDGHVPSFMNIERDAVTCPHCKAKFEGFASKTFLGFRQYECTSCREKFKYPLYRKYRIVYWALLAGTVLYFVSKGTGFPSIYVMLMSLAILTDLFLLWKRR